MVNILKEEKGPCYGEDWCEQAAESIADGSVKGDLYGGYSYALTINGEDADTFFQSPDVKEVILRDISYPVKDGHAYYNGLDEIIGTYSSLDFSDKAVVADLVKLGFDEDSIKELAGHTGDDDDEIETWIDYDINLDDSEVMTDDERLDYYDEIYGEEEDEVEESIKVPNGMKYGTETLPDRFEVRKRKDSTYYVVDTYTNKIIASGFDWKEEAEDAAYRANRELEYDEVEESFPFKKKKPICKDKFVGGDDPTADGAEAAVSETDWKPEDEDSESYLDDDAKRIYDEFKSGKIDDKTAFEKLVDEAGISEDRANEIVNDWNQKYFEDMDGEEMKHKEVDEAIEVQPDMFDEKNTYYKDGRKALNFDNVLSVMDKIAPRMDFVDQNEFDGLYWMVYYPNGISFDKKEFDRIKSELIKQFGDSITVRMASAQYAPEQKKMYIGFVDEADMEELDEGWKDNLKKGLATAAVAGGLMSAGNAHGMDKDPYYDGATQPFDDSYEEVTDYEKPEVKKVLPDGTIVDQFGNEFTKDQWEALLRGEDPFDDHDDITRTLGESKQLNEGTSNFMMFDNSPNLAFTDEEIKENNLYNELKSVVRLPSYVDNSRNFPAFLVDSLCDEDFCCLVGRQGYYEGFNIGIVRNTDFEEWAYNNYDEIDGMYYEYGSEKPISKEKLKAQFDKKVEAEAAKGVEELKKIHDMWGGMFIEVAWRASNGETGYKQVNEAEDPTENDGEAEKSAPKVESVPEHKTSESPIQDTETEFDEIEVRNNAWEELDLSGIMKAIDSEDAKSTVGGNTAEETNVSLRTSHAKSVEAEMIPSENKEQPKSKEPEVDKEDQKDRIDNAEKTKAEIHESAVVANGHFLADAPDEIFRGKRDEWEAIISDVTHKIYDGYNTVEVRGYKSMVKPIEKKLKDMGFRILRTDYDPDDSVKAANHLMNEEFTFNDEVDEAQITGENSPSGIDFLKTLDEKGRYMFLSRMQQDCGYFLDGHEYNKFLWAGNVEDQIKYMKWLYNSFPKNKKPEWISMEEIEDYEKRMAGKGKEDHSRDEINESKKSDKIAKAYEEAYEVWNNAGSPEEYLFDICVDVAEKYGVDPSVIESMIEDAEMNNEADDLYEEKDYLSLSHFLSFDNMPSSWWKQEFEYASKSKRFDREWVEYCRHKYEEAVKKEKSGKLDESSRLKELSSKMVIKEADGDVATVKINSVTFEGKEGPVGGDTDWQEGKEYSYEQFQKLVNEYDYKFWNDPERGGYDKLWYTAHITINHNGETENTDYQGRLDLGDGKHGAELVSLAYNMKQHISQELGCEVKIANPEVPYDREAFAKKYGTYADNADKFIADRNSKIKEPKYSKDDIESIDEVEVGDFFWDSDNYQFYRVIRRSKASIWVEPVKSKTISRPYKDNRGEIDYKEISYPTNEKQEDPRWSRLDINKPLRLGVYSWSHKVHASQGRTDITYWGGKAVEESVSPKGKQLKEEEIIEAEAPINPLKEGDILYSSWGYSMKLVDFYKVIGASKSFVKLAHLADYNSSQDEWGQAGEKMPKLDEIEPDSGVDGRRFKVHTRDDGKVFVMINNYEFAEPWDGKPKSFDTYD